MAQTQGRKKNKKQKSGKSSPSVKKAKLKPRKKASPRTFAAKGKQSSRKAKKNPAKRREAKPIRPIRSARKEKRAKEVELKKPVGKPEVAPVVIPPARLLIQTKTTSAALALLGKGVELVFQREFKKAKNELKSLIEMYPGELDIVARARSYIQICEREEANQKKHTVSSDQLYALGVMEHNKANYDSAVSYFLQSLEKHPNADYIYYSLAASQAMKGDAAKAIENLRRAVELNEDSRIYAKNDADFAALQSESEFAELVGMGQSSVD